MKGHPEVIKILNKLLADELTAINQYMVHAEMCEDWGYSSLYGVVKARAIKEMKHAEKLISRILFLGGSPEVDKLNPIHIGSNIEKILKNDHQAEAEAYEAYNEVIKYVGEKKDFGSRRLLEKILQDEEEHLDFLEEQLDQIEQMGIENYLSTLKGA